MRPSPAESVQRASQLEDAPACRLHTLPVTAIRPIIRIAHRRVDAVNVGPRLLLDHEIVLLLRGQGEFRTARQAVPLLAGHAVIIPPYTPHVVRTDPARDTEHLAIHFDLAPDAPPHTESVADRPPYAVRLSHGYRLPVHMTDHAAGPLHRPLREIIDHFADPDPLRQLDAVVTLQRVLIAMLRMPQRRDAQGVDAPLHPSDRPGPDPRTHKRLQRVIDHIADHLHHDLSVPELAEVAGMSPTHFTRRFKEWTGQSPAEYVRRYRVQRARVLLGQVDLSMKEIAARVGFHDPYRFSKVFRRVDGLSPSKYREALLAADQSA